MQLPALLYALNLINRTKFNKLSVGTTGAERKQQIYLVKSLHYLVAFKLAAVYCITNKVEARRVKKVFKHYECEEDYKAFLKLCKMYPKLMRKLKHKGLIPQSVEEVKNDFSNLYFKYKDYIAKYTRKKLVVLVNKYRSYEDIERDFLESILLAYYKYFLRSKDYVENTFKLVIRNQGKLMLESACYKSRREIRNIMTEEDKITECTLSEELMDVLKAEEKEDVSELRNFILFGEDKYAVFCRILLYPLVMNKDIDGIAQDRIEYCLFDEYVNENKIKKQDLKCHILDYALDFMNMTDQDFEDFKQRLIHDFL